MYSKKQGFGLETPYSHVDWNLPLQRRLKTLPSHHKRDNCRHIALRRAKEPSKSCAKGAWSCSAVASREVIQVANGCMKQWLEVDVSENNGTPQIIHFNRVFHYKPSILGYPYFWKHLKFHFLGDANRHVFQHVGGQALIDTFYILHRHQQKRDIHQNN